MGFFDCWLHAEFSAKRFSEPSEQPHKLLISFVLHTRVPNKPIDGVMSVDLGVADAIDSYWKHPHWGRELAFGPGVGAEGSPSVPSAGY